MYEKYGFMIGASATISSKPIFETIHFLPRSHPQCVQFVLRSRRIGQLENQFVLTILQRRPFHLCLKSKTISWANVLYCFFSIEHYMFQAEYQLAGPTFFFCFERCL